MPIISLSALSETSAVRGKVGVINVPDGVIGGVVITIVVGGTLVVTGTVVVGGTTVVTGTVVVGGTLVVTGIVVVGGTEVVGGIVVVTGTVVVGGTVVVAGTVVVGGGVSVNDKGFEQEHVNFCPHPSSVPSPQVIVYVPLWPGWIELKHIFTHKSTSQPQGW